ncbi:MAG TPA: hypothetical protein VHD32_06525 [Candidatus Didemnitutus sp.]|nr:hypothetical protein [Candidatus Didemnitutus sp.]
MHFPLQSFRSLLIAAATFCGATVILAQTAPAPAPGGEPSVQPAHPPSMPMPGAPSPMQMQPQGLPPFLQGVITLEEYQALQKFRRDVDDGPEMKALNDKIKELRTQLQAQQREVGALRQKALESNPEIKAINEKIQQAMRAHSPMPGMGQPHPMMAPPSTMPTPGPVPTPGTAPTPAKN